MASFNQMENYLGNHPYVGATISILHFVLGVKMKVLLVIPSEAVMKWMQFGAFGMGMLAAAFTIYGVIKTHHGKSKKP
jgi:hypothetical protein